MGDMCDLSDFYPKLVLPSGVRCWAHDLEDECFCLVEVVQISEVNCLKRLLLIFLRFWGNCDPSRI